MKASILDMIINKNFPKMSGAEKLACEDVLIHGKCFFSSSKVYGVSADKLSSNCRKIAETHREVCKLIGGCK